MCQSVSPLKWVAVVCFAGSFAQAQQVPVQSWITTTDEHGIVVGLEKQPDLTFGEDSQDSVGEIHVNERVAYQSLKGGGAAFTDGAAWLINQKLSPVQRDEVMRRLFDPVEGIGISFLRNPVGSSDLTREWYTLDDNAADRNDPSLPNFSIDHDLTDVIPLTLTARKLNPRLTLMINAWSPPAWMKSSGSLVAGDVLPQYYAHHANYFVKAIQAYEAHGLHVNYVSLNNEPTCCEDVNYPSLRTITSAEMATMLKGYWVPGLREEPPDHEDPASRLQLERRRSRRAAACRSGDPELALRGRRGLARL